jgi:hypothetical protein
VYCKGFVVTFEGGSTRTAHTFLLLSTCVSMVMNAWYQLRMFEQHQREEGLGRDICATGGYGNAIVKENYLLTYATYLDIMLLKTKTQHQHLIQPNSIPPNPTQQSY